MESPTTFGKGARILSNKLSFALELVAQSAEARGAPEAAVTIRGIASEVLEMHKLLRQCRFELEYHRGSRGGVISTEVGNFLQNLEK